MKRSVTLALAAMLCSAPLLGVSMLRRDVHELYDSPLRFGAPSKWLGLLMGARSSVSEIELQPMQSIDQFWFAFEKRRPEQVQAIAKAMVEGEGKMGARAIACASTTRRERLEDPEAEDGSIVVCVAAGEGADRTIEVCSPQMWSQQSERLVLLSVFGRDTQLRQNELLASCRATARHWRQWSNRR